jgi:hypothetical protein
MRAITPRWERETIGAIAAVRASSRPGASSLFACPAAHRDGLYRAAIGRDVEVPLDGIESAGVRKFSLGKTVLLGSGVIVGLAASLVALGTCPPLSRR